MNWSFKYPVADFPFIIVSKMFPKSCFIDVPPPRALIRQCWKGENVALHQLHHGDQPHDPHSFVPVFPDGGAGERLSTFQMPAKNCKKGGWCSLLKHVFTKSQAVNPVFERSFFLVMVPFYIRMVLDQKDLAKEISLSCIGRQEMHLHRPLSPAHGYSMKLAL